jgi:hypothetical protein
MRYAHFALLTTKSVSREVQEHVRAQIEEIASRVRPDLRSADNLLNWHNHHPLGIQVVVITSDDKTVLRERRPQASASRPQWGVALGGYCREEDRVGARLDVERWARRELSEAIGTVRCASDGLVLTGLHRNRATGSLDLLGFWRLGATAADLKRAPASSAQGRDDEDRDDLYAEFEWPAICKALSKTHMYASPDDFAPEALVALLLALKGDGRQVPEWQAWTPTKSE